ncbi:hypothetical protein X943_000963 [Babesia divergens]|uniref:Poly(A) RNA polymerase mitochondrial-like central palm domain-containing protein n=1 Tax=Babesia divergens TaxID=32595 RepID=A0AAD9GJN4_BABDI|nr:hypothetical protein X943_000963 [Babesia divergens]
MGLRHVIRDSTSGEISRRSMQCHRARGYSSATCVETESITQQRDPAICGMLLELHSVCYREFSTCDKLELLELCHKNKLGRHQEFAALMIDVWKDIGTLKQHEILVYHKICKEVSDELWDGREARSLHDSDSLYERQFSWELNILHNHTLSPTLEQYRKKQDLIQGYGTLFGCVIAYSLKSTLEKATNGTLHTFGSCENGLWVRGSDVDMCLEIPNCNSKRHWLSKLHLIRSTLSNNSIISNITIISAKVPIAKLYNRDNHNFCDISINNTVALDNTRFVKAMVGLDYRVVKLARFIKYWATCRCINNRSQGTLSSYTLILQLFYFLQNRSPPILPLYKDIELPAPEAEASSTMFMTDTEYVLDVIDNTIDREIFNKCAYLGQNEESLTQLLFDFFSFYSDERFQGGRRGSTIDLYTNDISENHLGVLVMKCPITGKNVNPFTITMWQSIYREFKRVDTCIKERRPIPQICMKVSSPPLEVESELQRKHARMMRQMMLRVKVPQVKGNRVLHKQELH